MEEEKQHCATSNFQCSKTEWKLMINEHDSEDYTKMAVKRRHEEIEDFERGTKNNKNVNPQLDFVFEEPKFNSGIKYDKLESTPKLDDIRSVSRESQFEKTDENLNVPFREVYDETDSKKITEDTNHPAKIMRIEKTPKFQKTVPVAEALVEEIIVGTQCEEKSEDEVTVVEENLEQSCHKKNVEEQVPINCVINQNREEIIVGVDDFTKENKSVINGNTEYLDRDGINLRTVEAEHDGKVLEVSKMISTVEEKNILHADEILDQKNGEILEVTTLITIEDFAKNKLTSELDIVDEVSGKSESQEETTPLICNNHDSVGFTKRAIKRHREEAEDFERDTKIVLLDCRSITSESDLVFEESKFNIDTVDNKPELHPKIDEVISISEECQLEKITTPPSMTENLDVLFKNVDGETNKMIIIEEAKLEADSLTTQIASIEEITEFQKEAVGEKKYRGVEENFKECCYGQMAEAMPQNGTGGNQEIVEQEEEEKSVVNSEDLERNKTIPRRDEVEPSENVLKENENMAFKNETSEVVSRSEEGNVVHENEMLDQKNEQETVEVTSCNRKENTTVTVSTLIPFEDAPKNKEVTIDADTAEEEVAGKSESNEETAQDANDKPSEQEVPEEIATKSQPNAPLIQTILQQSMASEWKSESHRPYVLSELQFGTCEYNSVKNLFSASANAFMSVQKIERVENPYLLGIYLLKKDKMERMNITVEERSLFHGTRESNLDSICRYNFDWRRCGQSRGHIFGQGVSFSPKSSYARHYSKGDDVLFLAKVLVSKVTVGDGNTVVPNEPYDTTKKPDGTVIVKYSDDDFYPQYIIHYKYR